MDAKTISIFVDESGSFTYPDEMSPYYLVGLVLHDQDKAVRDAIARYERELDLMGLTHLCFHAGPIIRREECFQLADLICTVSLIARKLDLGYPMTNSEHKFFGGPRVFTRNILRSIKPREI